MDESTEGIYFQISVGEESGNASKIEALATKVESANTRIEKAVTGVGNAAVAAVQKVDTATGSSGGANFSQRQAAEESAGFAKRDALMKEFYRGIGSLEVQAQNERFATMSRGASQSLEFDRRISGDRMNIARQLGEAMVRAQTEIAETGMVSPETQAELIAVEQATVRLTEAQENLAKAQQRRAEIERELRNERRKQEAKAEQADKPENTSKEFIKLATGADTDIAGAKALAAQMQLTAKDTVKLIEAIYGLQNAGSTLKDRFLLVREEFGLNSQQFKAIEADIERIKKATSAQAREANAQKAAALSRKADEQEGRRQATGNSGDSVASLMGKSDLKLEGAKQLSASLGMTAQETEKLMGSIQRLRAAGLSTSEMFRVLHKESGVTALNFGTLDQVIKKVDTKAALEDVVAKHKQASERVLSLVKSTAQGAATSMKGLAQLGILSEDNSAKMLKSIVAIEGVYNAVRGGLDVVGQLSTGWKTLKEAMEAARTIKALTVSLSSLEAKANDAVAASLVRQAGAQQLLNQAQAGGGIPGGKVGGGAVGKIAGSAASTAAGMAGDYLTRRAATSAAITLGGSMAGSSSVMSAGGLAMATAGSGAGAAGWAGTAVAAAPYLAIAAAVAAAGVGMKMWTEQLNGSADAVGSWSRTTGEGFAGLADKLGETTGWFDLSGKAALKEAEARSVAYRAKIDEAEKTRTAKLTSEREASQKIQEAYLEQNRYAAKTKYGENSSESLYVEQHAKDEAKQKMESAFGQMDQLKKMGLTAGTDYANALKLASDQAKIIEETNQNILQINQAQARVKKDEAKSVSDSLKKELEDRRKMVEEMDKSRQSAIAAFAGMSAEDRTETTKAMKIAKAGGSLNFEQRDLLDKIGTDETKRYVQAHDMKTAAKFGFSEFDSNFNREMQVQQSQISKIEAQINEKTNININIEAREETLRQVITEEYYKMKGGLESRTQAIVKEVFEGKIQPQLTQAKSNARQSGVARKQNGR